MITPTKRSQWAYKKSVVRKTYSKLSPKLTIVDAATGVKWIYNPAALAEKLVVEDDDTQCYLGWLGAWHRQGFCMFPVDRKNDPNSKGGQMNAQRLLKAIELDRPLLKIERVIATCHNPACLNIKHLTIGTREDSYNNFSATKGGRIFKTKYDQTFLEQNRTMILTTSEKQLSVSLEMTLNQARYLRAICKKRTTDTKITTIDLRTRK
jgi:hypothetical protein